VNPALDDAKRALDATIEAFRAAAARAVDAAADPRAPRTRVDDARHAATFGLAAVGAALKVALRAARPSEDP
jgi:hypothetical protein